MPDAARVLVEDAPLRLFGGVVMLQPLVGFAESLRYELAPLASGPYALLSSLDEEGLRFVVVPPQALFTDYRFELASEDVERLALVDAFDVETWVLVSRAAHGVPTVNLLGPLVINRRTRLGMQVVLGEECYGPAVRIDAGSARTIA